MTKEDYDKVIEINKGIQDYLSIMNFDDKDETKWIRKQIAILRKEKRQIMKGKHLS